MHLFKVNAYVLEKTLNLELYCGAKYYNSPREKL